MLFNRVKLVANSETLIIKLTMATSPLTCSGFLSLQEFKVPLKVSMAGFHVREVWSIFLDLCQEELVGNIINKLC